MTSQCWLPRVLHIVYHSLFFTVDVGWVAWRISIFVFKKCASAEQHITYQNQNHSRSWMGGMKCATAKLDCMKSMDICHALDICLSNYETKCSNVVLAMWTVCYHKMNVVRLCSMTGRILASLYVRWLRCEPAVEIHRRVWSPFVRDNIHRQVSV